MPKKGVLKMHSRTRASLAALAAFLAAVHGSPARPEPLHILQETDGGGAPEPESPPLPEGLRWFSATYSVQGATYHIEGVEPADGPPRPVYAFFGGDTMRVTKNVTQAPVSHYLVRLMAQRGFSAAMVEYPGMHHPQELHDDENAPESTLRDRGLQQLVLNCEPAYNNSLPTVARRVFTRNAFEVLCGREGVDCGRGLAVHGVSLGGLLSTLSPQFAPVTALLIYSSGTYIPGADSCCGIKDRSCCQEWAYTRDMVGGNPLPCMMDAAQQPFLPRSRRRTVIGSDDLYYGGEGPLGAVAQASLRSGTDCGASANCIDDHDGFGYYIPSNDEVGQRDDMSENDRRGHSHAFILDLPPPPGAPPVPRGEDPVNPRWVETDAPWGATASCDWLATAARREPGR